MDPPIEKYDSELSNRKKHNLNYVVCNSFNLGRKQGKSIVDKFKNIKDAYKFIDKYSMELSEKTDKNFIEIFLFCKKYLSNS